MATTRRALVRRRRIRVSCDLLERMLTRGVETALPTETMPEDMSILFVVSDAQSRFVEITVASAAFAECTTDDVPLWNLQFMRRGGRP